MNEKNKEIARLENNILEKQKDCQEYQAKLQNTEEREIDFKRLQ